MSRPAPRSGLFEALPARVLEAVDHSRLRALIDRDAQARCLAVVREIDVPVHTVGYECRLAPGDARVDVGIGLVTMRPADSALGRLGRRRGGDPAWQRCLAFLADWSRPCPELVPAIPFVCLAFDRPDDPATQPAPAISLCVDPDFFARRLGLPMPSPASADEIAALAGRCHQRLRGEPLPAACRRLLDACVRDGTMARHISLMVSRTPATFKLDLRMPIDAVAPLLHRIGWPGSVPDAVAGIRAVMPWRGHVQLNLVLHPALGTRLEVELLTDRGEATAGDRSRLLDRLVAAGHCDPAKAAALSDAWARPVSDCDGAIVARSWYIKVQLDGGRITEAKAYLGLMSRVLRPRAAVEGMAGGALQASPG
jgi:hypothetical protein